MARNNGSYVPRNKEAKRAYYEQYGKLMAAERVWEIKAAKFGRIQASDRIVDTYRLQKEGVSRYSRKDVYTKALELYDQSEFVRPAINIIAAGIFAKNSPVLVGDNKELIEFVRTIIEHNQLNFHDLAREAELAGDVFLWFKAGGDRTEIRSLDASRIDVEHQNDNIRVLRGYRMQDRERLLSPERIQHVKINSTTTSVYGRSSIRHVIYWLNVIDNLFEQNLLRGAQYFGNPLIVVKGVPGPYQSTVKNQIEGQIQRAGRTWVLPPDSETETPDFSLDFPIMDTISWVFRLISIATEIPITLFGTADAASRGTAFFATPRFELSINPRREVWRIGLREFFLKIARATGVLKANQHITRQEFDFGFTPMFDKDLADLSDLIEVYRDRGLISARSARQMIGLDHDREESRIDDEGGEDKIMVPGSTSLGSQQQVGGPAPGGKTTQKGRGARREARSKRQQEKGQTLED
jgi:hypothetical protein